MGTPAMPTLGQPELHSMTPISKNKRRGPAEEMETVKTVTYDSLFCC